ncbi:hypothetical protein DFO68_10236 [Halomonas ventosae]|uniref:Uncharacterized protein n=1 Tax=Halomonas ventosae TaxID=229007 RepID=A0A4R6I386_9GAMM|nr:hypothetical protein DFO68_10236 [Halomonas ventosae]
MQDNNNRWILAAQMEDEGASLSARVTICPRLDLAVFILPAFQQAAASSAAGRR